MQMGDRQCTIDGCPRAHRAKGLCATHYRRFREGADMNSPVKPQRMSAKETLDWYTRAEGDCLIWTGPVDSNGYGAMWVDGRQLPAHRVSWGLVNGEIPKELLVDHICWNRRCVSVDHLRLATRSENSWNRSGATSASKTGVLGVYLTDRGDYRAQYAKGGKRVSVGRFGTIQEAKKAIEKAREDAFGIFAGRVTAPNVKGN